MIYWHIYCFTNFIQALKNERSKDKRQSRQDDEEDQEEIEDDTLSSSVAALRRQQATLLSNYLEFDPTSVMGPLLSMINSAAARNTTGIDENYKKLPPLIKTEVKDFIQVFNELLKSVDVA
jgi:CBS domain containing-hemolysin-like protein